MDKNFKMSYITYKLIFQFNYEKLYLLKQIEKRIRYLTNQDIFNKCKCSKICVAINRPDLPNYNMKLSPNWLAYKGNQSLLPHSASSLLNSFFFLGQKTLCWYFVGTLFEETP